MFTRSLSFGTIVWGNASVVGVNGAASVNRSRGNRRSRPRFKGSAGSHRAPAKNLRYCSKYRCAMNVLGLALASGLARSNDGVEGDRRHPIRRVHSSEHRRDRGE